MSCPFNNICGGCSFRDLPLKDYRQQKIDQVRKTLSSIAQQNFSISAPVFINDNTRRRASFAFAKHKGQIVLGFNAHKSNDIIDISSCALLTPKINSSIAAVRYLLETITKVEISDGNRKNSKISHIDSGDIWITETDNGLDIVLEFPQEPNLDIRQIIFEFISSQDAIIRISHRKASLSEAETIVEKAKPFITIAGYSVFVPAGTFLQPSKEGEQALISAVLKYLDNTSGNIADLFCGVGTFSYALSTVANCKVTAVDSSEKLLSGFRDSLNRQMINNVEIKNRNLFKYPLEGKEMCSFNAIVFDPPRAGAKEQVQAIASLPAEQKPQKIIAVSCNPNTFVRDAEILCAGGYNLVDVTIVDQFIYSPHCELVALFTKA